MEEYRSCEFHVCFSNSNYLHMNTKTQIRFRWSLACLVMCLTLDINAQKYLIDPGHTSVQTKVLRFEVVPVVGRFNDVSGSISFDADDATSAKVELTIKTASYSANNEAGGMAIKSPAFLDVASFPEIKFALTSLKKTKGGYTAKGSLELHGVKKEIEVPAVITGPDIDLPTRKQSIGITGSLIIDRTAYGVGKQMQLPNGRVIVSNEVQIDFVILGIAE